MLNSPTELLLEASVFLVVHGSEFTSSQEPPKFLVGLPVTPISSPSFSLHTSFTLVYPSSYDPVGPGKFEPFQRPTVRLFPSVNSKTHLFSIPGCTKYFLQRLPTDFLPNVPSSFLSSLWSTGQISKSFINVENLVPSSMSSVLFTNVRPG